MSILITGAAGFIGSHLTEALATQANARLICLDNFNDYYDPSLKRANAETIQKLPNVEFVEGDFRDFDFTLAVFQRHEVNSVVHLGAYAGVRVSVETPRVYQETNVGGTLSLLEAARRYPVDRFLLISSSTVYGNGAAIPFNEDAPLGIPASPYGATKRAAELMGLTYYSLHNVPTVCIRPFSVYGPRLRPDLALSIFTAAIAHGQRVPLFGDGSIRRDFTHVDDICTGLIRALSAQDVIGQAINLGHSEPIEMRQIISMIEDALGKKALIDQHPERPEDLPVTYADLTKAERLLDYRPRVPIKEGIQQFCDWYRQWHASA